MLKVTSDYSNDSVTISVEKLSQAWNATIRWKLPSDGVCKITY